ncbi:MAG TPA: phage antirepressor KilAC domain-containing protein [Companilactobacillus farciminis]|uniref:Phage antirepressor KilAC domain-containing protein n=1 Tax=Companilactobacillus farciminis TaxID=1612 RepID=A0A921L9G6_9LACO|nr:phage antirepressor KilAC domain-containing protein [Companilactobacillus farciminis]
MNQKFENNLFELEVKMENEKSLFDVETVAKSLGISRVAESGNEVVRWERVNKYLGKSCPLVGTGDFIPEAMVYKLAFKANNALAEKFQDWLANDVLPQIRKYGMYATEELLDNPDLLIQVATQLKEERNKRIELEQEKVLLESTISEYEPKINYLDIILDSEDTVTVTQIAQDYGMTPNQLNKILNRLKVQYKVNKQWILTKKYKGQGYVKSSTFEVPKSDGGTKVVMDTRWTQKGRIMLYDLLKDEGYYPQLDLELD